MTRSALKVVAFGDSITQGNHNVAERRWPRRLGEWLQQSLGEKAPQIINAGVGGNTSSDGLARLEQDVLIHQPALVLVEFGGNDATPDPVRHVPVARFGENLVRIFERITAVNAGVIFMTFPPIVDAWHVWGKDPQMMTGGGADRKVEQYRQMMRDQAAALGARLFDLDHLLRETAEAEGWERYLLPDGVHLTDHANERVARTLAEQWPQWMN